ncbi:MAG TPA: phospholipase D-like domain-containing protein [Usitatibacter sp.]|nr:phospholipase D-like domain-containing protein [Usitatibacter sp.]
MPKLRVSLPRLILLVLLTMVVTVLGINLFSDPEKKIRREVRHAYGVEDPQFSRAMGVLLGPALVEGNRVETLLNGDEIFPAMLSAIRSAKRTITFETYIYWSGGIGQEFADALSERARAGVKVHILVDWVGSQKMDAKLLGQMREAGVELRKYHALRWYTLDRLNNRTHRKLLVVDGRVGFTGGVGIADDWSGHAQDKDHWRDTHYRLEGPAVAQMQAAFMDNWTKVTGRVYSTPDYFPALAPAGELRAQVFKSSIDGGAESIHLMYLLSVAAATRSIDLSMAYFVPDDVALDALVAALRRGVKVRIILPGPISDAKLVQKASRAKWGALLAAGGEIWQYQPTMFHCKVLVVDSLWTSVGSTNFDTRSFRLNDESNLNVLDAGFAKRQEEDFARDLAHSRRVTLAEWAGRPWTEKAWEHVLALFDGQL